MFLLMCLSVSVCVSAMCGGEQGAGGCSQKFAGVLDPLKLELLVSVAGNRIL